MTLDPSAFDALYSAHAPAVYRSALGIVRDPDAAADVVQETFVRAYTATDEIVSPAAWLGTVARRLALNELRRRGRLTGLVEDATDDDEPAHGTTLVESAVWTDPAKSAASADSVAVAAACLDELRPDDRTLLTFRYGEGLEIGAIAGLLGRTVNATTVALHRARARFDAVYAERVFRRAGVPESCRPWRADAVAHADGKPASAEYIRHLATCAPCQETDFDLRSRSKAFAFAPLLGLPLAVPATLKATVIAGLAGKGIAVGAASAAGTAGVAAAGTAGTGTTAAAVGATGSATAATGSGSAGVGGAVVATGISAKVAIVALAAVLGAVGLAATVGPMALAGAASSPLPSAAAIVSSTAEPTVAAAVIVAPTAEPTAGLNGVPITTDGREFTLIVATVDQKAVATFDCSEGVRYGAKVTDLSVSAWFRAPDGRMAVRTFGPLENHFVDWTAPLSGVCALMLGSLGSATGPATIQVWAADPPDMTKPMTTDGTTVTIATETPAQNAILTFACTEATRYRVTVATELPIFVSLFNPDSVAPHAVRMIDTWTASVTGTCRLLIDPRWETTGSATASIELAP